MLHRAITDDNVTMALPKHRFVYIASILMLLGLISTPIALADWRSSLPNLGNPVDQIISKQQEQEIGSQIFEQLRAQNQILQDPLLEQYISDLGARLVAADPETQFPPNFVILKSPAINAFVVPGGHVAIFSGLMLATEKENELAGVMAHELGHASQRHIAQSIASQAGNNLTAAAGLIAGILLGLADPQLGAAAATAGMAGAAQRQINYTRMHEREADRFAIQTMRHAGYNPEGVVDFFTTLQRQRNRHTSQALAYLQTHPLTSERISSAQSIIESLPDRDMGREDSRDFQLARARLAALSGVRRLNTEHELAASYFEALRAIDQNADSAQQQLHTLLDSHPGALWFALPLMQLYLAEDDIDQANALLQAQQSLHPSNHALLAIEVEIKLEQDQAELAYQLMRQYTRDNPENPQYALLTARAAEQAGRNLDHHEAMGRYFYLGGNLVAAHQEYRTALALSHDRPQAQARLKARLDQIEEQAEQQQ